MKTLDEMKKELDLRPIHIMLLTNTGSMTVLLEALFGRIRVETETQQIVNAKKEVAGLLEIRIGEDVNYRLVRLIAERTLVHATSYAPLSRLKKGFKEDIMKRDVPIGRIMEDHTIESRREIIGLDWLSADKRLAGVFGIEEGSILLKRVYNIIHDGKPLINITEVFPHDLTG